MKVLIYMPYNTLKRTGGPRGYLYNLNCGLKLINTNNVFIEFLPVQKKEKYKNVFNRLPKFMKQKYYDWIMFKRTEKLLKEDGLHRTSLDLSKYDIIHFHSSLTLLSIRDSLKDYKGLVLLTNHSPKPQYQEWIEDVISKSEYKRHSIKYDMLSKLEAKAYDMADYIIFPCKEAEEPCINNWELYKEIKERNRKKYRYILTGTDRPKTTLSRNEICKKYNIPMNAFIISYVGRHNVTKGYDVLLEIGQKVIQKHTNVYFLVAGKEGPLYGLKNNRWIEIGWIDDPGTYYSAADIFILPNKETYFDLVMLEALSAKTVILARRIGGNKYFEKYHTEGIKFFDTVEDAIDIINQLIPLGHGTLKTLSNNNIKIYEEEYTVQKFAEKYISFLQGLPINRFLHGKLMDER